jgi:hypothetical protein
MKKLLLVLAVLACSDLSQAALQTKCSVWGHKDSDPSLELQMVLPFTLGEKLSKMPTTPSALTVIDKEAGKLVFDGEISHLNEKSAEGYFETFTKNLYPIRRGSNPLRPTPVATEMRRLTLDLALLEKDGLNGRAIDFNGLSFNIEQTFPNDSTFTGEGSVTIAGQKYDKLSFNCFVSIAWGDFERLMTKAKDAGVK